MFNEIPGTPHMGKLNIIKLPQAYLNFMLNLIWSQ